MTNPYRRPRLSPALTYRDPRAALDWLEHAFGFARVMVISDPDGHLVHAEMRVGDGTLMVGTEWADHVASPASVGGRNTQTVHVHLDEGLDAHCARAQAAGAVILREPEDQFYGDRTYIARDLEGHVWTFGQTIRAVTREEAEAATGLTIEGWV
jgi:uncharacterized glyoxalase superfamily protein PhnB